MNKKHNMIEKIKLFLQEANIEEALKLLASQNSDAVILLARFRNLSKKSHLGLIDYSEESRQLSQIVNSALFILEQLSENETFLKQELNAPEPVRNTRQLKVFLSYSHKDEDIKESLDAHLTTLKRCGFIDTWDDRKIQGGEEWDSLIKKQVLEADIILLLISANFIASEYIWKKELSLAIERHEKKEAVVVPIFIKPCDWTGLAFSKIQGIPRNGMPVTKYPDYDEALMEVAKGVRMIVDKLIKN